ncbi:Nucleotide-binding protein [Glarea lozoyensis ATCC 20868]|uniref:NADPH:adrenodoxin oxidoreductase, mitochondrial n=1 Tax=Glarea lozoyensis (strain ATCC 20868 / MF5171) TaxID=1116229 RepID=S3DGD4_GLAL2|nr:Nucleotide-binding protein [Glarea lozoyensis ATCC 20868]EPE31086.1 Nucleotide-binding protein [Glarea lozoyensis ATCC 20868]
MAVIGSGPAGFYTSYKVMSKIEDAVVDMYEHLPVPFGLVRFGVAPDHPDVKNCQDKFQEVAESPRFNFVGNIAIGNSDSELPLQSLLPHYDAILFAYGASKDRTLNIPGEGTLKGIYSARAFVGWYNGLPEYAGLAPDLSLGEEAVVIGQGNVALDVARILLEDVNVLRKTDITDEAIQTLEKSKVKRVNVVGRRGPLQAAFSIKEVRELVRLPNVAFHPVDATLIPKDLKSLDRPPRRIMEVLLKGGNSLVSETPRSWSLDFCMSPTSFNPDQTNEDKLGNVAFEKTSLHPSPFDRSAKAIGTGEKIYLPASLAMRSIGYKSEALPGFDTLNIPFDNTKGVIPNDFLGRVVDNQKDWLQSATATPMPGMYCAGWVKRGPTGVIASTMDDAFSTASSIVMDWKENKPFLNPDGNTGLGWEGVKAGAAERNLRRISWEDWKRIDAAEKENGRKVGKEREKFTSISKMLAVLD